MDQLNNVDHKIPTLGDSVINSLKRVDSILKKSEIIPVSDVIKLRASERAIQKKAPFHRNKNSFSDAIIIETYYECLQKRSNSRDRFAFITHNKQDFSDVSNNEKHPHPDFKQYFSKIKSLYFIKLSEALHRIRPEFVSDIMIQNELLFEPRTFTEILVAEDDLINKIWYNRHHNLLYKIEQGDITIIDRKDFKIENSHTTIVKDILAGAKQSARKVEKKYGLDNLGPWDDFEWGMINGKLSALRWVMGEDWDELYT